MRTPMQRQWGSDLRADPPPAVPPPASDLSIALGRLLTGFTVVATIAFAFTVLLEKVLDRTFGGRADMLLESLVYVAITMLLALSCLMYLVARLGALYRTRAHRRTPRAVIDAFFDGSAPTMTVLVPSYQEELSTVRMTLLSAALQEYPALRVVLLLDDPPWPTAPERIEALAATRRMPTELMAWLAEPRARATRALARFEDAAEDPDEDVPRLAEEYLWAGRWLCEQADREVVTNHAEKFFAEHVLRRLGEEFEGVGDALVEAHAQGASFAYARLRQLHHRLVRIFDAEITSFERKVFASLSHEANKAMNLNSYLGLMGRTVELQATPRGQELVDATGPGAITIPDSEYVLTLDADSIVLPEYCLRLVHVMTRPDNAGLAVVQTPYSAIPGSGTRLERLAGATTDVQHIVHQGMSYYGATFWVGANAVIRKVALDDIVDVEFDGENEIRRYVMDRTVIEDTESSLDLAAHGWRLLNYPERLSYSATPPDFGALCIQRRRWANGGLLILPRLREVRRARVLMGEQGSHLRTLLRLNYLASTCWSSLALVCLLFFPFDSQLLSPWVIAVAAPYFVAMSWDLRRCGYRYSDMVRIYGLNLILLPVNVAGVLKSLQQGITGRRIPFARTPKIEDRTATPLLFALSPLLIIGFSALTLWRGLDHGFWVNAAFAGFNAATATYALVALMGLRATTVDIVVGLLDFLRVPVRTPATTVGGRRSRPAVPVAPPAWEEVLYRGAPGTVDGQHAQGETGQFRILARPTASRPPLESLREPVE